MPRLSQNSKSNTDPKKKKTIKTPKKEVKKRSVKKEEPESLKPTKKAKPVIVDIIKDDEDDTYVLNDYSGRSGAFEYPDFKEEAEEVREQVESYAKETFAGDLDSQKKFFAELGSEIENRKKELEEKEELADQFSEENLIELFDEEGTVESAKKHPMKIGLYRRFVWRFLFVVAFLALLVSYFSFSKLSIDIVPKGEIINDSLQLKVSGATTSLQTIDGPQIIKGEVREVLVNAEADFLASGEEYAGEAISGKVKIINNYSRNQSLIASTRLLSPDNKIFRIKETVSVPAGGERWVEIYVEKPSREFAINPTTFTIPGLWVGLQDKIYAKSEEAFVFEEKKEMYVRPSDIAAAEKGIKDEVAKKLELIIKDEIAYLEKSGAKMTAVYLAGNEVKIEIDAKADDKVTQFKAKASGNANIVFFSKDDVEKLAIARVKSRISDEKELAEFDSSAIVYNLVEILPSTKEAIVQASFSGKMLVKGGDDVIERESLLNLSAEQISAYLREQPEVKDFTLNFSPAFIKKAPRLVDRIEINLINE